jgi:hypothetical protein
VYANGNVYEGEWVDGRINGFGTLTYADGDKYIGLWVDGKMNGEWAGAGGEREGGGRGRGGGLAFDAPPSRRR